MSKSEPPPLAKAAGKPLQWLTKLSDSSVAQKVVYRGAKAGMRAAGAAASAVFTATQKLSKPARLDRPDTPSRFDLNMTDEQRMMRDMLARFGNDEMRPAAEAADEACAPPAALLQQSHELGISLLAIPEALGGAAEQRSMVSNALVAEELARGDMGLALAMLSPHAVATALVDWGAAEQQAKYLPAFAGDDFVPAAIALVEPMPVFDPARPQTGAVATGDGGWKLHGSKTMVPLGETAELFVVAATILGVGPRLFLVERGAPGLEVTPAPTMGLRAAGLCRLDFDGVRIDRSAMLGEPGREGFDFDAFIDRARIAWCDMAVGGAQAVLDYVKTYVNDRKAFGEPVSNRQSVAFMVADIAIELEGMRLMTYRAASRAEQGKSVRRESYLAKAQCATKGMKIGTDGVQLLGGHGFIKDHPVERWYRHLRGVGIYEGALLV